MASALTIRKSIRLLAALGLAIALAACSDNTTTPEPDKEPVYQSRQFTRDDLTAEGEVVETTTGYTVKGALHVDTDEGTTSFLEANLNVEFDDDGRVMNVTGSAQVPSPHERVEFADPVQADVGFFRGGWLNENREFIPLKDDTDYFVFNIALTFEMRIATGDTGEEATRPVVVKAPLGGQILMIIDYNDPMYYTYAAQDLIGDAGVGWSLHSRIPFVPTHPVEGLGFFDGQNTRVGSMTVFKILSVSGQSVDNEYTEVHLYEKDPLALDLRSGYQMGTNGAMALDLFVKDVVGVDLPIADGTCAVFAEASVQDIFQGYAYLNGETADFSWWPAFIPAKPAHKLETRGIVHHTGDFDIEVWGQYGWELPTGLYAMNGGFRFNNEALTLKGGIVVSDVDYQIVGTVAADATRVGVTPPPELINMIDGRVHTELDDRIAAPQKAWDDLQAATADYEVELSLRGLRSLLPGIVDVAKKKLSDGIAAELRNHEGKVYYNQLKSHLHSKDDAYYTALNRLKAAAQEIRDNDTTRREIEAALRAMAAKKIFKTTFEYKVLGQVVKTVNVSKRIMSDTNANKLITAANNVQYIKETADRKILMQEIYDNVPDKEIFEQVKDDIENGVALIPGMGDMGFEYAHDGSKTLNVYVMIDGQRHDMGEVDVFSVPEMAAAISSVIVDVLTAP